MKEGEIGLRQSDAVFHHTRQLPEVLSMLGDKISEAKVIGVSERPRDAKDSYMPCFLVGIGAAQMLAQALGVPLRRFSHQQGHIAAALYSAQRLDLLHERFLAFHMSGGTTEAVLVEPVEGDKMFRTRLVASSLDLKAGQVIDRIGVMLGLPFPAGKHLDPIACNYTERLRVRASMKGANCSLSGVENKCRELMKRVRRRRKSPRHAWRMSLRHRTRCVRRLSRHSAICPWCFRAACLQTPCCVRT